MSKYEDPFKHWNLRHVINASGTMTSLGASRVRPEVSEAVAGILNQFVSIDELQQRAGEVIAKAFGTESGCVTACTAAGVAQGVAAALTGCDLAAIEQLPDCAGRERRVAIQMGHMICFGARVHQSITLTGAQLVPLGSAAKCEAYNLEFALEQGLAAAVYVVSHHTVRENELPMDIFIETCHKHNVPVIVDMASEHNFKKAVDLGADLTVVSGHKFLGGATSGIIAGKGELVRACHLQNQGIARSMKCGKESIVGAMAALEVWQTRDANAEAAREEMVVQHWLDRLDGTPGLKLFRHPDWTGNPITRLKLYVDPEDASLYAWELAMRLRARDPSIVVRDDLVEHGKLYLDPCNVDEGEAELVAGAIIDELNAAQEGDNGRKHSWSDVKRLRKRD